MTVMAQSNTELLFERLPTIYRTQGRAGYVYRLISLFGREFDQLARTLDGLHHLLNPKETKTEFLDWLASWVALELDKNWPVDKQRKLITNMVDLYKWRGTIEGIATFVEIYTGLRPYVIEGFNAGWRIGVQSTVGVDTKLYESKATPHCFSVIVNSQGELTDDQKQKVKAIVELQKPAHTFVIHYGWSFTY